MIHIATDLPSALATINALEAQLAEMNSAITWETSCLNCASLLDASAEQYFRAEDLQARLAAAKNRIERALAVIPEDQRKYRHHLHIALFAIEHG